MKVLHTVISQSISKIFIIFVNQSNILFIYNIKIYFKLTVIVYAATNENECRIIGLYLAQVNIISMTCCIKSFVQSPFSSILVYHLFLYQIISHKTGIIID